MYLLYLTKAYKQFGNRIKATKRKLEEVIHNLPSRSGNRPSPNCSADADAPSPTSSAGSDLELPDAFGTTLISTESTPMKPGMDLDSRITFFLAGGSQVSINIPSLSIISFYY